MPGGFCPFRGLWGSSNLHSTGKEPGEFHAAQGRIGRLFGRPEAQIILVRSFTKPTASCSIDWKQRLFVFPAVPSATYTASAYSV